MFVLWKKKWINNKDRRIFLFLLIFTFFSAYALTIFLFISPIFFFRFLKLFFSSLKTKLLHSIPFQNNIFFSLFFEKTKTAKKLRKPLKKKFYQTFKRTKSKFDQQHERTLRQSNEKLKSVTFTLLLKNINIHRISLIDQFLILSTKVENLLNFFPTSTTSSLETFQGDIIMI